jgi:hypothetical protein
MFLDEAEGQTILCRRERVQFGWSDSAVLAEQNWFGSSDGEGCGCGVVIL